MKTFSEWVHSLDESKKGIVPDFIADKLKHKDGDKKDHKEGEDKPKKEAKWKKDKK